MFSEFDRLAMTRALALAERGLETTNPNPRVGCVIAQGDRIIAEGWHERAGEAHAEVMALRAAKESVAGSTVYVTLEPCSHHGRTPPCSGALIEARVARVVFAVQDPNPQVSGQGAAALLRAGIAVEAGLMQTESTELNVGFMKRMKDGLPWVRVKLAMSLDGRTALANGASQWITGESARADVQRWRARCSAVMTGVGTVLGDDPRLNVRTPGFKGRQPLRVVLDAALRTPPTARLLDVAPGDVLIFTAADSGPVGPGLKKEASAIAGDVAKLVSALEASPTSVSEVAGPPVIPTLAAVATSAANQSEVADDATWAGAALSTAARPPEPPAAAPPESPRAENSPPLTSTPGSSPAPAAAGSTLAERRAALEARGVRIVEVPVEGGYLDLSAIMKKLAELEVNEALLEAGPTLAGQVMNTFFADELLLYIAPKLLGPQGRPLVNLPELQSLQDALGFSLVDAKRFGEDVRLRMRPK